MEIDRRLGEIQFFGFSITVIEKTFNLFLTLTLTINVRDTDNKMTSLTSVHLST